MTAKTYDIVIVGAGVIGSVLALSLAKEGYTIALLDAQDPSLEPTNPERVIALSEGSKRYLSSLGVWDDIAAGGAGLIQHIAVREPQNIGAVDMSHQELDSDALGYVLEIRHVLAPTQQAFTDHIKSMYGVQCLGFRQDEAGICLQVQDGGKQLEIQARLLIGADGTHSFIRSFAGIQTYGWDHNRLGIVASIACEHGHNNTAYECFKEEGPLALLPLADDRFSLVWSVAPKTAVELLNLNDESFLHILHNEVGDEIMGKLGRFTSMGKRASFPLELRVAKSFAQGRVLLAGNAAHTIHPIAGQGMNLGLRDVAVLADVLQQTWAKEDLNKPLIGQTYAERRRLDTLAVAGFTEGVLETFASSFLPKRWLRGRGLQMMQSTPVLKQFLLKQAAGIAQLEGLKS
ncbi:FAD-dependent oxidoreductase [Ghiorsea bivora]|uniref:FAD-dependent oxidoreductase n=1 Tax=Ghiorsea bivora TaxID=1485545 RepID=UPI0005703CF4|nr:FAD-dependent oxidoreductase [Ghiorsea bivora]